MRNSKKYIYSFFVFVLIAGGTGKLKAQSFKVDTIVYNGDPSRFINIVFMGDGFQTAEMTDYLNNVRNLTNYFFTISPFAEYKNYFNVFAINVPSVQSGANHPGTATDEASSGGQPIAIVNNYFNSSFDIASIHRLLAAQNFTAINNVLVSNFPLYDQIFMLVNSTYYGGSGGGSVAVSSLSNDSYEVLIHEIGHSFAGLADEYYAGDVYAGEFANMTKETNPALVKWKNWIGFDGIGIYQHCCGGNSALWYKPHQNCKMQFLGQPFCAVCKEKIVETIHDMVPSLDSYQPSTQNTISYCDKPLKFNLTLNKTIPNSVKVNWKLNGNNIAGNVDSIALDNTQLNVGNNTLSVIVIDSTLMVRAASHFTTHADTINWTISSTVVTPTVTIAGSTSFCEGDSVVLTASAGSSYLWSNGATTQRISAKVSGNYSVTRTDVNGCSATSLPITVTVIPFPQQPTAITGSSSVCEGSNQIYSVAAVAGAANYTWTLPTGWSGSSTTNSISAIAGNAGGTISVKANNACGSSAVKTLDISVNKAPAQPNDITGNSMANVGQALIYSINPVAGATGYTWTISGGGTITNGQNTDSISVNWSATGNHTLTVNATNSCGSSANRSLTVNVSVATGIYDPDDMFQIRVLPNPSTGEFYLHAKNVINKEMSIEIINIAGQKVHSEKLRIRTNEFAQRINISEMANGIYSVRIQIDKKLYLRRIVKSN